MHETLIIIGKIFNACNCMWYNQAMQACVKVNVVVEIFNIIYSIHPISELIKSVVYKLMGILKITCLQKVIETMQQTEHFLCTFDLPAFLRFRHWHTNDQRCSGGYTEVYAVYNIWILLRSSVYPLYLK